MTSIIRKSFRNKVLILIIALFLFLFLFLRFSPYKALSQFMDRKKSCRFYDRNHTLIQISSVENGLRREWTDFDNIPQDIKKAIIKSEDKRFYFHNGVDSFAIIHAFFQNLKSKKNVRGASTITMQLVKIISKNPNRNYYTKITDALNAYRMEARFSKREILELYLNNVPFGYNCEGITSAARTFFSKELIELTKEEITLLIASLPNPTLYNPIKNPDACCEKAHSLYKKTFSYTNENELKETIRSFAKKSSLFSYPFEMPHLIQFVKNNTKELPNEITLSTDLKIQNMAESFLFSSLKSSNSSRINNASLLLINNADCSVLAWIGNASWSDSINNGQIDGVLTKNQAGSSMKPFLYALSMEQRDENHKRKYFPSSILEDIPLEFGNSNLYIPHNFNNKYNGPVRFRIALSSSLNVPSVAILNDVGVETYLNKLFELGFDSLKQDGEKADLGLALGAGEVKLYELVTAFSVFSRDGKYMQLSFTNEKNKKEKQIYEKDVARIICSILSDKNARALGFGYNQTFQTEYDSIFKTGTSNQYQNIIALGSTKDWTIGIWMGNFSGETVIGKTGSSLPAATAKKILDNLTIQKYKDFSKAPSFDEPENWTKKDICSLSGMIATKNCNATIKEYIENGTKSELCSWHKAEGTYVLPSEYQQWAEISRYSGKISYSSANLEIRTPQNNAIFYFDNTNQQRQAIPFEIIGGNEDFCDIFYDNSFYKTQERPFSFSMPVEYGQHEVKIICGNMEKNISFEVK